MFCEAVQLATVVKGPSCTLKSQLSSGFCRVSTLLRKLLDLFPHVIGIYAELLTWKARCNSPLQGTVHELRAICIEMLQLQHLRLCRFIAPAETYDPTYNYP